MKNIAKVISKINHKLLVTAVCVSTLGAQFAQITNVKADTSIDPAPQEQSSNENTEVETETPKTSTEDNLDSDKGDFWRC